MGIIFIFIFFISGIIFLFANWIQPNSYFFEIGYLCILFEWIIILIINPKQKEDLFAQFLIFIITISSILYLILKLKNII